MAARWIRGVTPQITVAELKGRLGQRGLQVLDVRRQGEWEAGHIAGADWYPLDRFKAALPSLPGNVTIAVHCKGGYRSMIAASLLQRAGHKVINVIGGYAASRAQRANAPQQQLAPDTARTTLFQIKDEKAATSVRTLQRLKPSFFAYPLFSIPVIAAFLQPNLPRETCGRGR